MKYLLFLFAGIYLLLTLTVAQPINGTFAIQNIISGKNLRPYDAGNQNGNQIVLYNHVEWKCMTWKFTPIGENTYLLRNLFTSKTFQPKDIPAKSGTALEQQPVSQGPEQQWEFLKAGGSGGYYIRLKGTELYITSASSESNSNIVLKEKQNSGVQLWKLVAQNPEM